MIIALIRTVQILSQIFFYVMLVRCFLSWIPPLYHSAFGRIIRAVTDPALKPCQKLLGKLRFLDNVPIDFSPVLAILAVEIIEKILVAFLAAFIV
ncbi:MAG: YggT family protein [Clostridia bacterium]|nr:YggT family protein [Clostridia bacterium]